MVAIDQQPNDLQVYDVSSFSATVDSTKLELPSSCSKSNQCGGVCAAVRTVKGGIKL